MSKDEYITKLEEQKRELQKERLKLQTEKIENNKWLRENARDELIVEKLIQSIEKLEPLTPPEVISLSNVNRSYLLAFSDCHYGIEVCIKDLTGNILNEYSPEIFEERMYDMLIQVVALIQEKGITELNVWELGDSIQGIIRLNSQLMKLRYGIVDSTIRYAEFMANWLNELSKYVRIKFQMNKSGNHDQLRICNAPKNAFEEENMGKVIWWFLKERLKDNPNVDFLEYNNINWTCCSTFSVAAIHGEVKDLAKAVDDISRAYQTHIDYLIGGHCHHSNSTEIGVRNAVMSVRSIIGIDPYGMSMYKTADAGASLFTFEQFKGLVCEDKIVLN